MWVFEVLAPVATTPFLNGVKLSSCLCQSPACDASAWSTLRRGHGCIWRGRLPGADGGGAPQSFRAQFDWLAEAKSPKCPDRPLVRQKTAGKATSLLRTLQRSICSKMSSHLGVLSLSYRRIAKQVGLCGAGEGHPNILIYTQICWLNPDPNPTLSWNVGESPAVWGPLSCCIVLCFHLLLAGKCYINDIQGYAQPKLKEL